MVSLESIVDRQIRKWELQKKKIQENGGIPPKVRPIITVSRQQGSRGSFFAKELAKRLDFELFHRELIDFICKNAGSRRRLIESLDEHVQPQLQLWLEGIVKGKIIDSSDYMQWLAKSIFAIAAHGDAVIIGRGANFILKLNTGLHIRVVAPKSNRISNLIEYKSVTVKDAEKMIEESDRDRRDFAMKYFDYDINNPIHYDLVINTAYLDIETALELAEKALNNKIRNLENKE